MEQLLCVNDVSLQNDMNLLSSFGCADIVAVTDLFGYWWPNINAAVWITLTLAIITFLNSAFTRPAEQTLTVVFHVKYFGEAEFYFASLKIILILMLILMAFVVMLGGNPEHDRIGFRYWKDVSRFPQWWNSIARS